MSLRAHDPSDGVPVGLSADTVDARAVAVRDAGWRFHLLGEVANFDALRRYLGVSAIAGLTSMIAERIAAVDPNLRVAAAGRRHIEIDFEGSLARDVDAMLATIHLACDEVFLVADQNVQVDMIFGTASAPAATVDETRLIEDAEAALAEHHAVERAGLPDRRSQSAREIRRVANELAAALTGDQLLLQYQPKVHLRRQEINSIEALVRWRHPERGLVYPGDFIGVAEKANLIGALTLWTLRQAIKDQRRLVAAGHPLRVFVNISGQLVSDPVFVQEVCALVEGSGALLGFEITETSVIRDPSSAITHLQAFADIGVTIAIDDYGAGLSSLAYMKQLPARELKIDKLFVTQLTSSNRDPLIVRSTIDLAHALEMEVVAEGVETHAALALLTVMGCDMVQGFLISRPIGFDALVTFLDEEKHRDASRESRDTYRRLSTAWKRG